jgi:hypothetical protein
VSAAPSGAVDQNQLNQLYEQYLGRGVDPSGASTWAGQCVNQVIAGITGSQEYANRGGGGAQPGQVAPIGTAGGVCSSQLNQLYNQYLGRCADVGGASTWQGKCINQVIAGITGSQEYANRGGQPAAPGQVNVASTGATNSPEEFVNQLYQQVLGRPADSGAQNWINALQSGQMTPQDVANSIAASQEVQQNAALQGNAQNYANALASNYNVCTASIASPASKDPYLKDLNIDPEEAKRIYDLKTKDPNQYYAEIAAQLKNQVYEGYRTNSNFQSDYDKLQSLKTVSPTEYYKAQLEFLSNQIGWQIGQNTSDRAKPVEEQIKALVPEAQKAGLTSKQIEDIVNKGASSANQQNQQRIANEAETGGSGFNFGKDVLPGIELIGAGALTALTMDPEFMAMALPAATTEIGAAASTVPSWLSAAGQGAITGGTLGAVNAGISGGCIGQGVLRGAATGAIGSGIGAGVGNNFLGNVLGGVGSGALGAKLAGANVGKGALVGGLGGAMNYGLNQVPGLQIKPGEFGLANLARGAITGATLNKVMGGCFAKGLQSGAINSVLNYGMNKAMPSLNLTGAQQQPGGQFNPSYQSNLNDYYSQKLPYEAYQNAIQNGTPAAQAYANYNAAMEANGFPINQATGQPWSVTGSGYAGDGKYQQTPAVDTSTIGNTKVSENTGLPNPEQTANAVQFVQNMTPEQNTQVTAQLQNAVEDAKTAASNESQIQVAGSAVATAPSILEAMSNYAKSLETGVTSRLAALAESNPAIRAIMSSVETAAPYLKSLGISAEAVPAIVARFGSFVANPMVAGPILGTDIAARSIEGNTADWAKYANAISPDTTMPEVKFFDPGVKEPPIVEPTKPSPVAPPAAPPAPTRPVPVAPPAAPPVPVPVEPIAPPVPGCAPTTVPKPTPPVPGCTPARPTPRPTDVPGCVPAKPIPGPTPVETPVTPGTIPVPVETPTKPQTEEETKVQPQVAPGVKPQTETQTQTETDTKTATEQEQAQKDKVKKLVDTIVDTTEDVDTKPKVKVDTKTKIDEKPFTDVIEAPILPPALTNPEAPIAPEEPIVPIEPLITPTVPTPSVPTPTSPTAPKVPGLSTPVLKKLLTPGKCRPPCFAVPHPKAKTIHGQQVRLGLGGFNVAVEAYQNPVYNPTSLQQIQSAATGGQMKKLSAGGALCTASSNSSSGLQGHTVQGAQVALPMSASYSVPLDTYLAPIYNPTSLQQIQAAKCGGSIQHMATGGFPAAQGLMHGRRFGFQNPVVGINPLASGPAPLAPLGRAEGGDVHTPEFYSEGGLNHTYVKGEGDGTSDSIPAMLANGEFVIPADVVSSLGNGSNDSGAHILDEFLKTIRSHKRNADAKHLPPDSKGALGYLLEAKKKAKK